MTNLKRISILAGALWLAACSTDSGSDSSAESTGGQALGGNAGTGGTGAGGTPATGGATPAGTGGQLTGGAPTTGGLGSGGSPVTGGAAFGGTPATGGAGLGGTPTTGGASAGGTLTTGGTGAGGAPLTGGAESGGQPSGGTAGAGGTADTGGSASGGDTSGGAGGAGGAEPSGGAAGGGGEDGTGGSTGPQHWVATWGASPYLDSGNPPPASLANSVLRQVTHVSIGGSQLRVQFSNLPGNGSVTINSAHIALCRATPLVDSTIDISTEKALSFSGAESVTIAQGQEVWSDPLDFDLPALANVTITTAFGNVPSNLSAHSGSRTTSYLQTNSSNVSAPDMASAQKTDHWFYIAGIDVMADAEARAVVAIGDSITDGRGTDTNGNNRWTDVLAERLQANPATANVAVINQGIGATNLIGMGGTAAQARFNRDVIGTSGVAYAIVFDGVNDIGGGASTQSMTNAYNDLIQRGHDAGLLVYGGTLLPFNGSSYYSTSHETVRQEVNTFIRSGAFDGVIDFDAAVTDGGNPPKLQELYATWAQTDYLHPSPAGYRAMGEAVDLALFTP
jgi:lysophospholipase L1-like esterase